MKKNKLIDRVVYLWSKKPEHYKEVRNPPRTAKEKHQRKSTNQTVRQDDKTFNKKKKAVEPAHWHWLVWWKPYYGRKTKDKMRNAKNSEKIYYNEYGEKTSANRDDHHIKKGET